MAPHEEGGFEFYEPTTIDPDHWILTATIVITVLLLVALPFFLRWSNRAKAVSRSGSTAASGKSQEEPTSRDDVPALKNIGKQTKVSVNAVMRERRILR